MGSGAGGQGDRKVVGGGEGTQQDLGWFHDMQMCFIMPTAVCAVTCAIQRLLSIYTFDTCCMDAWKVAYQPLRTVTFITKLRLHALS